MLIPSRIIVGHPSVHIYFLCPLVSPEFSMDISFPLYMYTIMYMCLCDRDGGNGPTISTDIMRPVVSGSLYFPVGIRESSLDGFAILHVSQSATYRRTVSFMFGKQYVD